MLGAFKKILEYLYSLSFKQRPDYERITSSFYEILEENGYNSDSVFDWEENKHTEE